MLLAHGGVVAVLRLDANPYVGRHLLTALTRFGELLSVVDELFVAQIGGTGLWNDEQVPGLARVAAFLREHGSVPAIQLAHAGRKGSVEAPWGPRADRPLENGWPLIAPSPIPWSDEDQTPREMTRADMDLVRRDELDALKGEVVAARTQQAAAS